PQHTIDRHRNVHPNWRGRNCVADLCKSNPVPSDPHTRFMSWGLWASAAFDYPVDTRGYTWSASAALDLGDWSARGGIFLEPKEANGMDFGWDVTRARGIAGEGERWWELG